MNITLGIGIAPTGATIAPPRRRLENTPMTLNTDTCPTCGHTTTPSDMARALLAKTSPTGPDGYAHTLDYVESSTGLSRRQITRLCVEIGRTLKRGRPRSRTVAARAS